MTRVTLPPAITWQLWPVPRWTDIAGYGEHGCSDAWRETWAVGWRGGVWYDSYVHWRMLTFSLRKQHDIRLSSNLRIHRYDLIINWTTEFGQYTMFGPFKTNKADGGCLAFIALEGLLTSLTIRRTICIKDYLTVIRGLSHNHKTSWARAVK